MAKKDLFDQWIEKGEADNNLAIMQSLSMQGKSITEIASCFEISKRTLLYLQKKHPAIERAIKQGRLSVVAMCQNKLMERVSNGDTTAIIYALKIYGGDFFNDRRVTRTELSGSVVAAQPQVQIYLPEKDPVSNGGDNNGSKK